MDVLSVAGSEFITIGGILVLGAAIAAVINSGFSRSDDCRPGPTTRCWPFPA